MCKYAELELRNRTVTELHIIMLRLYINHMYVQGIQYNRHTIGTVDRSLLRHDDKGIVIRTYSSVHILYCNVKS